MCTRCLFYLLGGMGSHKAGLWAVVCPWTWPLAELVAELVSVSVSVSVAVSVAVCHMGRDS